MTDTLSASDQASLPHLLDGKDLLLLGCGKMGSAMLTGWLKAGVSPAQVHVRDPNPSEEINALAEQGLRLNEALDLVDPAAVLLAVKPQIMEAALPALEPIKGKAPLFISIAAGKPLAYFEAVIGEGASIIRSMPNTPAAIGRGITALIANPRVSQEQKNLASCLLEAIGGTVWLEHEDQMDAVTAVSGSGPAYVFYLIEALAAAGEAQGLAPELAMRLAQETVAGAGALAQQSEQSAAQLRINVTSPAGTTAAGLAVLMDAQTGLAPLIEQTVRAAADRSRALAREN
ncbi:MAG: pyrroline-5-carboxylate reductase [Neomegalonema sp.]|nr:pyrroline-5-carboxylate reductase [Neomegalonema sp.]